MNSPHPYVLLAAAGYQVPQPLEPNLAQALSTNRALIGIAGTALSQLADMQAGRPSTFVVFDLLKSR
jgi:hypothetical protein